MATKEHLYVQIDKLENEADKHYMLWKRCPYSVNSALHRRKYELAKEKIQDLWSEWKIELAQKRGVKKSQKLINFQ